jgi:hypothetical protein
MLKTKQNAYKTIITVSEQFLVYLDEDFVKGIAYDKMMEKYGDSPDFEDQVQEAFEKLTADDEAFEDAVAEAIENGWPGCGPPMSEWDEDTLRRNKTVSLGADDPTEVYDVEFVTDIDMEDILH